MTENLLVLDTHIWIWAVNKESDKLSSQAIDAIEKADREQREEVHAQAGKSYNLPNTHGQ
jgi:PIN domain nuclease of toxin-antitoxin system